jgi:hypothetical protein
MLTGTWPPHGSLLGTDNLSLLLLRGTLGPMAIHLILLISNKIAPTLMGSVHIYSDCLGALDKIQNLPPHHIPSKCQHLDVLKNTMLPCSTLSFILLFSHISAHQDDHTQWENLMSMEKLNCAADFGAKRILLSMDTNELQHQQQFLLEALCVWAGREKMTLNTGDYIQYHAHHHLAREEFDSASLLTTAKFDLVDWQMEHNTLSAIPRMFQVWTCKQVWSIALTNYKLLHWTTQSPLCPSCMQVCGDL